MKGLLVAIGIIVATGALAQKKWPWELWHEGKIVLDTGDTLKGLVKYDFQQDLLQFNDNKTGVEAYTSRKVLLFQIFDTTVEQYRIFYALPYNASGGYKTPTFFELLVEGKITLLSRESLEYRTYSSPYYYYGSYSRLEMVHKFYFLEENGNITEFIGKKSDLMSLMGRHAEAVDKYMRKNKLRMEDREDFAKIVTYYNSFF
jgi:hypothetical protein